MLISHCKLLTIQSYKKGIKDFLFRAFYSSSNEGIAKICFK